MAPRSLLIGAAALLVALAHWIGIPAAKHEQPAADIGALRAGCRWEIRPVRAWPPPPLDWTLFLDQCSGRCWVLVAEPGGHDPVPWRAVRWEPF